jgi:hypothetical protein
MPFNDAMLPGLCKDTPIDGTLQLRDNKSDS